VLQRADDTVPVIVAAHDLVPGSSVSPESLRTASIRAEGDVLATARVGAVQAVNAVFAGLQAVLSD